MAAALKDGDSAALDELYAIVKKMEIDNAGTSHRRRAGRSSLKQTASQSRQL
jgi:hypothetical protein